MACICVWGVFSPAMGSLSCSQSWFRTGANGHSRTTENHTDTVSRGVGGALRPQAVPQVRDSQLFMCFTSALVKHYIWQISFQRSFYKTTQENYTEDGAGVCLFVSLFVSPVPITAYGLDIAGRERQWAPGFVTREEALGRVMTCSHHRFISPPHHVQFHCKLFTATDPSSHRGPTPAPCCPFVRSVSVAPPECGFWQVPRAPLTCMK